MNLLSTQAPLNAMQLPYRLLRHITDFEDGRCYIAADSHAKDVLKTQFMKFVLNIYSYSEAQQIIVMTILVFVEHHLTTTCSFCCCNL